MTMAGHERRWYCSGPQLMLGHKYDRADDGPEVELIRYFIGFPNGSNLIGVKEFNDYFEKGRHQSPRSFVPRS